MQCIRCGSERTRNDGQTRLGGQRWRCHACGRRFTTRSTSAFANHGVPDDVVAVAVRRYVRSRLSYADGVEWFAERGLRVERRTMYSWVQRCLPRFQDAARVQRHPVGANWRVDATYTRLNGNWTAIYRAIDQHGQVVDAYVSERRNATAAQAFFERAITETAVTPLQVTTDKAKGYPPALRAVLPTAKHRTSKSLNTGLERDHGHLKQRLSALRGFKQASAADILARGHGVIRNLRNGFSTLTATVPRQLRRMTAWSQLIEAI